VPVNYGMFSVGMLSHDPTRQLDIHVAVGVRRLSVRVCAGNLVHRQRLEIGPFGRFPPFPDIRHLAHCRVHGLSLTARFSCWLVPRICSAGAFSGPSPSGASSPSPSPGRSRHNFCTVRYSTGTVRYNGLLLFIKWYIDKFGIFYTRTVWYGKVL
jgi:hypothetical protein